MKNPFRRDRMSALRDAMRMSSSSEVLAAIPNRLAEVITRYDALPIDPTFRHDVYLILAGSLDVAEAVVDQTFSVETATEQIGRQMEVLARLLAYMSRRPSRTGYTILIPESHTLIGQWGTEQEAESHLENLQSLGTARNALVVPCKILSQHVVQPRAAVAASSRTADRTLLPETHEELHAATSGINDIVRGEPAALDRAQEPEDEAESLPSIAKPSA